jgi:exosome complex component RRP41
LVCSISAGQVEKMVLVDLNYKEEAYEDGPVSDIPLAFIPRTGEITLLQLDGDISAEDLKKAIEVGKKAADQIYEIQKKAIKEKYMVSAK